VGWGQADKLRTYTQHGFKYGGSTGQIAMQQKKLKELKKLENEGAPTRPPAKCKSAVCVARLSRGRQLAATDAGGRRRDGGAGEEIENDLADLNEDEELPLRLSAGGLLDRPAMQLKGVGFSYDPKGVPLFKGTRRRHSLHIGPCHRHLAHTELKDAVATRTQAWSFRWTPSHAFVSWARTAPARPHW